MVRRFIAGVCALLALPGVSLPVAQVAAADRETIVFVCLHGVVNSQMAAAYFNKAAKERGLALTAVSRGIDDRYRSVPVRIEDGLALDGLEPANAPRVLTADEAVRAGQVLAFDTIPAEQKGTANVTYWSDVPIGIDDYETARDEINRRVDALIATLSMTRDSFVRSGISNRQWYECPLVNGLRGSVRGMEASKDRLPTGGFARLVPELDVFDLAESEAFWCGILGFRIAYQRPESRFMYLELQGCQIMLCQRNGNWETGLLERPLGRGINFQMFVTSVEPLLESLKRANWPLFRDCHDAWYRVAGEERGNRQFLVQDPDGYLLRFAEDLGSR